jgi:hypothetical protein
VQLFLRRTLVQVSRYATVQELHKLKFFHWVLFGYLRTIINYANISMKYCSLLLFIVCYLKVHSQDRRYYLNDSIKLSSGKDIFSLDKIAKTKSDFLIPLPIQRFVINDVRFDTSYVAVRLSNNIVNREGDFKKVQLSKGVSSSLTKYLNDTSRFSFAGKGPQLICFIKQLRITQRDSLIKDLDTRPLFNCMSFEVEAYLQIENNYYPALRMDTQLISITQSTKSFAVIADALDAFVAKASSMNIARVATRKVYTLAELDGRYASRFDKPILRAQQIKKGVYRTSEEFMNNSPSLTDFQFKIEKGRAVLYMDDGKTVLPATKVYGVCDGAIVWISLRHGFVPMVRQGNTFEFISYIQDFDKATGGPIYYSGGGFAASVGVGVLSALANPGEKYYFGRYAFQLKMDDGSFY